MKKTIGIMLIMIGAGMLSFRGCNQQSSTTMNPDGTIQTVKQTSQKPGSFNWIPYLGAVVFLTGVIFTTRKKSS